VLSGVTDEMLIYREETFGPVAGLTPFDDEEQAITYANDTVYGLAAYFHTRDYARLMRVAEKLDYGIIGANTGIISAANAPFGGVKESGYGREGGSQGIDEYLAVKVRLRRRRRDLTPRHARDAPARLRRAARPRERPRAGAGPGEVVVTGHARRGEPARRVGLPRHRGRRRSAAADRRIGGRGRDGGRPRVAFRGAGLGVARDGGYAERVAVPASALADIPAGVSDAQAAGWGWPA
jgi:hypothetical protein